MGVGSVTMGTMEEKLRLLTMVQKRNLSAEELNADAIFSEMPREALKNFLNQLLMEGALDLVSLKGPVCFKLGVNGVSSLKRLRNQTCVIELIHGKGTNGIWLTDVINHLNASDPSLGRKEVTHMLYHLEEQELIQGIILKRVWPGRFMATSRKIYFPAGVKVCDNKAFFNSIWWVDEDEDDEDRHFDTGIFTHLTELFVTILEGASNTAKSLEESCLTGEEVKDEIFSSYGQEWMAHENGQCLNYEDLEGEDIKFIMDWLIQEKKVCIEDDGEYDESPRYRVAKPDSKKARQDALKPSASISSNDGVDV